jgi:hypothetical protein
LAKPTQEAIKIQSIKINPPIIGHL